MSIRVMTAVWDRGKRYGGGSLLVLLALADRADDAGRCFPSVLELAEKSRLTERQVYSVLKVLSGDGVLERTGEVAIRDGRGGWRFLKGDSGGRGRLIVYRIKTEMLSVNRERKPEKTSAKPQPQNAEVGGAETLKSATQNPEIGDTPISRTVNEPSRTVKVHPPCPTRKRAGGGGAGSPLRGEEKPDAELDAATEKLALECDVSGARRRTRLGEAIAQYARKQHLSPDEVAIAMIEALREYRDAMPLLRFRWGPMKFFTEGHWRNADAWPWDQQLLEQDRVRRQARVGMVQ